MIDIKLLRDNPEVFIAASKGRITNRSIETFLGLDEIVRNAKTRLQECQSERNRISRDFAKADTATREMKFDVTRHGAPEPTRK